MSYKLEKPYTEQQRVDFIVKYRDKQHLIIKETETELHALELNEIFRDGLVIVDPDYEAKQAQKEREVQILKIKSQLQDLDAQAVRPLRAILTDCGTDEDKEILKTIEIQANNLRAELSLLEK